MLWLLAAASRASLLDSYGIRLVIFDLHWSASLDCVSPRLQTENPGVQLTDPALVHGNVYWLSNKRTDRSNQVAFFGSDPVVFEVETRLLLM